MPKKPARVFFREFEDEPDIGDIFVFGSNLSGIHGKGAAKMAYEHYGAIWKQGKGLQGSSYAIPTKNYILRSLPLDKIKEYVKEFIEFAKENPDLTFYVTRVGCGLAGFKDEQIAPLFKTAPKNCKFAYQWEGFV